MSYGPQDIEVTSLQYRRAALSIRKMAKEARKLASEKFEGWSAEHFIKIRPSELATSSELDSAGVFLIGGQGVEIYAGETGNLREHLLSVFENSAWQKFECDSILVQANDLDFSENYALKSVVVQHCEPLLNSKVWSLEDAEKQEVTEQHPQLIS